jgi:hypothetical protein
MVNWDMLIGITRKEELQHCKEATELYQGIYTILEATILYNTKMIFIDTYDTSWLN